MIDLIKLEKKIYNFQKLNILIWIINFILIISSFVHYFINNYNIKIDIYFIIILLLNILSFYLTYLISDKLNFLKYKFKHFKNLK